MAFTCGIVGLPNVGKSTLFNALTHSQCDASNFPFCTIEPNSGRVMVPDLRLDQLSQIVRPQRCIPTWMEFVDIAGLVKGASQGEGLGNQFLSHIRNVEAIAQVVRCFEDPSILHVSGTLNPKADIETLMLELVLSDLVQVERQLARLQKNQKLKTPEAEQLKAASLKILPYLNEGIGLQKVPDLTAEDKEALKPLQLLTAKPMLFVANIPEPPNRPFGLEAVSEVAESYGGKVISICASLEASLIGLTSEDQIELLSSVGLQEPGLNQLIREGNALLGLDTFFTAGVKEVRAWSFPSGSTAPKAAGKIHSEFEKKFIRAEVIAFDDFIQFGGEQGAKLAGKWRVEGKPYIVQDGDVVHFRTGA